MTRRIILHVGSHKTGTKSIQRFLYDINKSGLLATINSEYPPGCVQPIAHQELVRFAMRRGRRPVTRLSPELNKLNWEQIVPLRVKAQLDHAQDRDLVYSAEGLYFLRYDDEFDRLRELFKGRKIEIIIFFREPVEYLKAYAASLRLLGVQMSNHPESIAYVESDSWLIDYPERLAGWQRFVGLNNVTVFNYDEIYALDGSVIPAFASRLGFAFDALPDLDGYFYNQRKDWNLN